ncbi:amino acid/amide ABC transporter membrane protein 2 (HAAT family) [Advenella incenata]|uniref:Amino acid/amide ABC transporter membrane protein 2 (HAAT family) n=1 Tax=Advenella incenata TaxID=267800 RepID=A0A4Q7VQ07_9BURK|nr:branched-chain amino acid ABC transporter permease [Advenella incenata]RZT98354.1 amino acid/amide ABC transporter membrane protein 2 (HAAT family) [Advenella incenata]
MMTAQGSKHLSLWGALIVVLAIAPLFTGSQYVLSIAVMTLLYAYLALSWNVLGGIAGQLSLGHSAYFGIGAYASTWLFVNMGISPWIGMWFGAALAIVAAVIVGMSSLHLRGAYFALATIASAMVIKTLVENADDLLGGPRGMEVTLLRDAPWQFQSTSKEFYYVIALVFVALALVINWRILRSRYGYYLAAVRNDQDAALALGVPTTRYKLYAAMISAAMTAIGGTFYAQFVLFVSPDKVFGANLGVVIAVVCIIGGRGTLWGPVLGALLLLPSEELARSFSGGLLGADMMLYGLLLMLVIWYEPRGLVAIFQRWFKRPFKQGVTK